MKRILALVVVLLAFGIQAKAQQVTSGLTPDEYVNDILLGSGVTAFNIQYTGAPEQIGHYTDGQGDWFPLTEGLVLSTQFSTDFAQEDCIETFDMLTNPVAGDPDLLDIANSVGGLIGQPINVTSVNDVCALEFDFIATGDTVKFNYSFASDEWLTWINSQYNDIFAFFLSGPGITGPYNSPAGFPGGAVNIAEVPGITPQLPITISSVNPDLNSEFYNDNPQNDDVCVNGFTVRLEAVYPVTCGETYHIKLAIADGSDTALESVVVLEAGSFTSNSVVDVDLSIDVGGGDSDIMYEDCGLATLTFTRPIETVLEIEEMIIIEYTGTATNGVDYTLLPDTIVFPPGVQSVQFIVDAFEDGIPEGSENVQMEILNLAACNGGGLVSYFEFEILDIPEPLVVEGYEFNMCLGDEAILTPIITGGYGNFTYEWDTGENTPEILVAPAMTSPYNVIVSDTCGMPSDDGIIEVTILEFPAIGVTIDNGDLLLNCNDFVEVTGSASGGDGNFTYEWQDQNGNNLFGFQGSLFYGTWQGASEIHLVVTDGCGFEESASIDVELNVPPIVIEMPEEVITGCEQPISVTPIISGGEPPYFGLNWYNEAGNFIGFGETLNYVPLMSETVEIQVQDACGQVESGFIDIVILEPVVEVALPQGFNGTCIDVFDIEVEVIQGVPGFQYQWTNLTSGEGLGGNLGISESFFETSLIEVQVTDACDGVDVATTEVVINNPPATVDLGEDIFALCTDQVDIAPVSATGVGNLNYQWSSNGAILGNDDNITFQSYATVPIVLTLTDQCGSVAEDVLQFNLIEIPIELSVSNDTVICAGSSVNLFANATGGEGLLTIEWTNIGAFGEEQYLSPLNSINYEIEVNDACGNVATDAIFVEVQHVGATFTYDYLNETDVQFYAAEDPDCDDCNFFWDFGDGNESTEENPFHEFDGLEAYITMFTVVNPLGCRDSSFTVIDAPIILYVPNAFTPNGDGLNDFFQVKGGQITEYSIQIFNRWGELVFESKNMDEIWNGSVNNGEYFAEDEIYNYVIKVKGMDTRAFERVGTITVIR
jgi:gliding motility-associated-like protein